MHFVVLLFLEEYSLLTKFRRSVCQTDKTNLNSGTR